MSKNYTPLHCHSHYSLLDGLSKPEHMVARVEEIETDACALTDHGSISGAVAFVKAMQKKGKKPILGSELYICKHSPDFQDPENRSLTHLPVLAKNNEGWRKLIRLTSDANHPNHFYHKPRLSHERLATHLDGNIIGFSGHIGSDVASVMWQDGKVNPNWKNRGIEMANRLQDMFGKGNFFLEVQLIECDVVPAMKQIGEMVREVSKATGIPCIGTPDAHYAFASQAVDQQVLLCTNMHTTFEKAKHPDFQLSTFFRSQNFHIPSYIEMRGYGNTEEELENTNLINSLVEPYTELLGQPVLPTFPCPDGLDEEAYLRRLCLDGWDRLVKERVDKSEHSRYAEQVKKEMQVFSDAKLSGYFLICQDIVDFVRKNNWLPGPGRGSAAGCLISYLIGITSIDPMPYDLLFERFYNAGRNTADHVSYPDIDMDVPVAKRDAVIDYIKKQYGKDRVSQMITFQTMKGSRAIKDVLRAYGSASAEEMNRLTKNIPDEAKIADELQTMKESRGESSIIRWALENTPDKLSEWCTLEDDDSLDGPFAKEFAQAMRLEGTKAAQSKHAAGIVIAPDNLASLCPMIYDSTTKGVVAGMEMNDLESIGMIKFDILGVAMLDKVMGVADILETGDIKQ